MGLASAGIGSGLDVTTIVSQLMAAEQAPLTAITTKQTVNSTKLSAYGTLKSGFASFQTAIKSLSDLSKIQAVTTTSSDTSVLSATSASGAVPGDYEIAVTQLAQAQKLAAVGQVSDSAAIGTGVLSFDFGSLSGSVFNSNGQASKSVTIDASCNTLSGIRDAINAANIGVNASIVNDGGASPYRLLLSNTQTGAANQMKISVSDGAGGAGSTALTALLTHNPSGSQTLTQTVAAQDAHLTVDGLAITKSSNSISDVVPGITLTLKKLTGSTPASLSVARDTATVTSAVQGLVDGYNTLMQSLKTLSSYDLTAKKGAALNGDSLVRSIQNQLRSIVTGALPASGSNLTRLNQVGITMQATGTLALDSAKLKTVIDTQFDKLPSLFATTTRKTSAGTGSTTTTTAATGTPSDPLVSYVGASSATQSGSYALSVNQLATSGSWVGLALPGSTTITAGVNDNLQVTLDGASASVTLAPGSYTQDALASAVQSAINSNSTFQSAASFVVRTAVNGALRLDSGRYGANSGISLAGTAAATLINGNLPTGTVTTSNGLDVAGTIDGVAGIGSCTTLQAAPGTASEGLSVNVNSPAAAGSYAFNISQLATQGSWLGGYLLGGTSITSGFNDILQVTLDGMSASVTLAAGSYTRVALASMVRTAINSNSTFLSAGSSVNASITTSSQLSLVSARWGSGSGVNLAGPAEPFLRGTFGTATTTSGQDVAGTFDGVAAVSFNGWDLTAPYGTPDFGLQLYVPLGVPVQMGSHSLNVSQLTTWANWLGSALSGNTTITAGVNDNLQVTLNGLSASVTLAPGTYAPETLASAVQTAINSNSTFLGAGFIVNTSISNGALKLVSGSPGSSQSISLAGTAAATLIGGSGAAATTTSGQNVSGQINGAAAVASGQTLTGASGNAAEGLTVNVSGGSTGGRGTITYTSASTSTSSTSSTTTTSTAAAGFAAQLNDLMSGLLATSGLISNRTDGISKTQRRLDDDKIRVQARLAKLQQSYQDQFTRLDTIMSKMNSTSSALTQQLAALAKSA